jgi:putative ATP-binding cassette transporter
MGHVAAMHFFQFIQREMRGSLPRLMIISAVAGVSNAVALAAINFGAKAADDGTISAWAAGLFVVAFFLFIKAQNYLLIASTNEIGAVVHRLQLRLMDQVRQSELPALEGIGRLEFVNAIVGHTTTLAQATYNLALVGQGLFLLFFVAIYIAYLSPLVFILSTAIICLIGWAIYMMNQEHTAGAIESSKLENRMFDRLTDLLDGFKEVRLNRARSEELFDDAVETSRTAANVKIRTQTELFKATIFTQSSLYALLGIIVFAVPNLSDMQGESIASVTLPLIFLVGTCFGALQLVPVLAAANAATDSIVRLENKLRPVESLSGASTSRPPKDFERIEMREVVFRRAEQSSDTIFQVGPLNFTLRSGDIVFITGGNGSGKSTFLKLLAGFYQPDSGEITCDGVRVDESTRDDYRRLFAAIFYDYHLFHQLYGIPQPDMTEMDRLLTQFGLFWKTGIIDGKFSTLDMSGGQRKRLALIVSMLEKRSILLLDEWTAEQDPEFRRKFYEELLPELSRARATVVMVTHDERHLNELTFPARRLRMDEGRLVEQNTAENGG